MSNFEIINAEDMLTISGGVNGGLVWAGIVGIAGGIVGCCVPGGQVCGAIGIYTGTVSFVAGLAY